MTLAALVQLFALDPKEGAAEALVETFAKNARARLEEMRAAHPATEAWGYAAHSLKSSAGMFGAVALAQACADAEVLGQPGATPAGDASDVLRRVEESLARALVVLAERFPAADLSRVHRPSVPGGD